jgi:hypothetical protein
MIKKVVENIKGYIIKNQEAFEILGATLGLVAEVGIVTLCIYLSIKEGADINPAPFLPRVITDSVPIKPR